MWASDGAGCRAGFGSAIRSPEFYTPRHLAEKILTSKRALEGERKQITVLFADLRGSLELLADRDPKEARKLLDPVLERMMDAVHHPWHAPRHHAAGAARGVLLPRGRGDQRACPARLATATASTA
jgi:hypothetical protein